MFAQLKKNINKSMIYRKNTLGAKGRVKIKLFDKDNNPISITRGNNLVVTMGRESAAKLLGGVNFGVINSIQFGTSNTPPALADISITNPYAKTVQTVSYPLPNSVRFVAALETTENNGMIIEEVGLISTNGNLFARYLTGTIEKTSAFRVEITWDIIF